MNTNKIIGIAVGLGVLFAMVWVGSKAWKAGQK
jgi:tetrahydromethanopterin S-methyltransferase subunit F